MVVHLRTFATICCHTNGNKYHTPTQMDSAPRLHKLRAPSGLLLCQPLMANRRFRWQKSMHTGTGKPESAKGHLSAGASFKWTISSKTTRHNPTTFPQDAHILKESGASALLFFLHRCGTMWYCKLEDQQPRYKIRQDCRRADADQGQLNVGSSQKRLTIIKRTLY